MRAFAERVNELAGAGARIRGIQMYTTARWTAERFVTPLTDAQLDHLVRIVRPRVPVPVDTYYGVDG